MGEQPPREPRTDIPRHLDDEFLASIGEHFEETAEVERRNQEIDVLCHRFRDLKRIAGEVDTYKGTAVTYLEVLRLPVEEESKKTADLVELARRAALTVDQANDMLQGEYGILNPQLLDVPEDAKRSLVHLTADRVKTANDALSALYKDVQDLLIEAQKAANDYHERAAHTLHTK